MKEMLTLRTGELETMLKIVNELGDEITIMDREVSLFGKFAEVDEIGLDELDEVSKRW